MKNTKNKIILVLLIMILITGTTIAVNDPGHDTLYIEETGDSELTGGLNITKNLSVEGGQIYPSGGLTIYGDDTTPTPGGVYISGTSTNNLYFDGQGSIYLKYMSGGDAVYIGKVGITATDLNVSGALYIQSGTATIGGTAICLANGTNCPSSLGGANITGVGAANRVAFWTDTGAISYDNDLTWNNSGKRLGIGTTSPNVSLHVVGNINVTIGYDICIEDGTCLSNAGGGGDITAVNTANTIYLYNGSATGAVSLRINQTKLNQTIDARSGASGGGWTDLGTIINLTTPTDNVSINTLFIDNTNGNIGIGTTSPNHSISTIGNISISSQKKFCLDGDGCSKYIWYNGSHVVIQG